MQHGPIEPNGLVSVPVHMFPQSHYLAEQDDSILAHAQLVDGIHMIFLKVI